MGNSIREAASEAVVGPSGAGGGTGAGGVLLVVGIVDMLVGQFETEWSAAHVGVGVGVDPARLAEANY